MSTFDDRAFPDLPSRAMAVVRAALPARTIKVEVESLRNLGDGLDKFSLTLPYPIGEVPTAPDGQRFAEVKMSLLGAQETSIKGVLFTLTPPPGQGSIVRTMEFPFPEPVTMGGISELATAVLRGRWDQIPVPHAADAPCWGDNDLPRWRSDAFDRLTARFELDDDDNRDFYVAFNEVTYHFTDEMDYRAHRQIDYTSESDVSCWTTVPLSRDILSSAVAAAGPPTLEKLSGGPENLVFAEGEQSSPFAEDLTLPGAIGHLDEYASSLSGTDAFERWSSRRRHMTEDYETAYEHGFLDDEPADKLPLDGERWYRAVGKEEGNDER